PSPSPAPTLFRPAADRARREAASVRDRPGQRGDRGVGRPARSVEHEGGKEYPEQDRDARVVGPQQRVRRHEPPPFAVYAEPVLSRAPGVGPARPSRPSGRRLHATGASDGGRAGRVAAGWPRTAARRILRVLDPTPARSPSMRRSWPRAVLSLVALPALALPRAAEAQPRPVRPDAPSHYAIVGARVVPVSGAPIERGTVVVRDGVITEVGPDVRPPEGAWVVDAAGKVVYPGLFDALTTLGHPAGGGPAGEGEDGADPPHSWGPEDRPGTWSWLSAADEVSAADGRHDAWRAAGVTTVLSTRARGLVTGQAAVLDLVAFARPREMVVATPVAMRLQLEDESYEGYPGSLMGSFAYLKQLYLDAAHYGRVHDAYQADPRGRPRPEWDATLEPIRRQLAEGWPVLLPARDRIGVERAIRTAEAVGAPLVVYGMQGAWDAADLLAEAGAAALVDVNWPSPPRSGDPEAEPELRDLRLW